MDYSELRAIASELDLWLGLAVNLWVLATALVLGLVRLWKRAPLSMPQALRIAAELAAGVAVGMLASVALTLLK